MRRREFLASSAAAVPLAQAQPQTPTHGALDPLAQARRHAIVRHQPTPEFFEGMLLGNGDIGLCVVTRPDALGLHIGKLDVWDIRVTEEHERDVKPFAEVMKLWREGSEKAKQEGDAQRIYLENHPPLRDYYEKVRRSYDKPWPRPWPCGTVWIHWDSRWVRLIRQSLDVATGVLTLEYQHQPFERPVRPFVVTVFVSRENGHIHLSSDGAAPAVSVAYYAYADTRNRMPLAVLAADGARFSCLQVLPATAPTDAVPDPPPSPQDRTFALEGVLSGAWRPAGPPDKGRRRVLLRPAAATQPLRLDLALFTSLERRDNVQHARAQAAHAGDVPVAELRAASERAWASFWRQSAVSFANEELERIWYHNQYFLACCLKPGAVAPGLFGNWSTGSIGTAWHGDYHMNYNTQQVWWGVFSSNHVEQHEPYVRLVEMLMPMAEWNARVQFGLPGAYFPHSAYPVPSKVNPYPVPPWGYEICETPWTVQSLWWQYRYTLDREYLRRVYPMLRAATDFLVAYLKRENDGKYHVVPTVSPENWGLTVDFRLNRNCIIDIALIDFLLEAMDEASRALDVDAGMRPRWGEIRSNLAPYPSVESPHGRVWLDIENAPAEWVYNVPVTLSPVFPAERVGLGRAEEHLPIARRTAATIRLEGGNDLVWQPLARARLGMLDLEWFLREVRYCRLPNGVANDRTRQIDGRYRDETNPDFMMRMGVWTENLSLPAVLNECLLQSWTGDIRVFPNTHNLGAVRFANLRAVGAFLVSASWDGRTVTSLRVRSEKGAPARIANPWPGSTVQVNGAAVSERDGILQLSTEAGRDYTLARS